MTKPSISMNRYPRLTKTDKWSLNAHTALLAINKRLKLERADRKESGASPIFPCAAMIDDLDALLRTYPQRLGETPMEQTHEPESCCKQNLDRIEIARRVLQYARHGGMADDDDPIDLIVNLLHLVESDGRDVEAFLATAESHWKAERHGGEDHGT